jgi:hypothetical protein
MKLVERSLIPRRAFLVCVCFIPMACGGYKDKVYPIRGQVFVNGEPAKGAAVAFHPAVNVNPTDKKQAKNKVPSASAIIEGDGSFQLTTYSLFDGAVAGDYFVTVTWREERPGDSEAVIHGPDKLGERYTQKGNGLKATVVTGKNNLPRFDLKIDLAKK